LKHTDDWKYLLPPDSVIFFGCVGKDKNAEILQEANKKAGLQYAYRYDEEQPTGKCGVVITGHNRSMVTDLAAANCYKLEHLKENWNIVEKSKRFFVGGFHLTVCVPAIMALAEEAAKADKVSITWPVMCEVRCGLTRGSPSPCH
jgi:adenosine kinase